jgi:hypothetical protein
MVTTNDALSLLAASRWHERKRVCELAQFPNVSGTRSFFLHEMASDAYAQDRGGDHVRGARRGVCATSIRTHPRIRRLAAMSGADRLRTAAAEARSRRVGRVRRGAQKSDWWQCLRRDRIPTDSSFRFALNRLMQQIGYSLTH